MNLPTRRGDYLLRCYLKLESRLTGHRPSHPASCGCDDLKVIRHLALRRGGIRLSSQRRDVSCDVFEILYQRSRKAPGHGDGSEVADEEQVSLHP